MKECVKNCIFSAIDAFNEYADNEFIIKKEMDFYLYGDKGNLDSLSLVDFIVSVEQCLSAEFGRCISLADEKAVSQTKSPFGRLESFIEYVYQRVADKA